MLLISLVLHVLTFSLIAHSYAIPIRRIKLHSTTQHHRLARRKLSLLEKSLSELPELNLPFTSTTARSSTPTAESGSSSTGTSSTSSPTPSEMPAGSGTPEKYVVAHHMVGNTFPYELQDWTDDIILAHSSGIDGFALNTGSDEWEPDRISDAYEAARRSGLNFRLFLSLDMTSLPCGSSNDAQSLRSLVKSYLSHPNQLMYDERAVVSTFSGESCTFGEGTAPEGWRNEFVNHPDLAGKIYFIPSFFIDPATFGDFRNVMDGDFNWNSGWPIQITTSFAKDLLASTSATKNELPKNNKASVFVASVMPAVDETGLDKIQSVLNEFIGSTETDKQHLEHLPAISGTLSIRDSLNTKPAYMAAVSPWFFTHYSPETFNKNFVFLSDQHLYSKRWESLIDSRDQFDIVQILTWNDYGESHYVGPIKGAQPNSEAWVDGMNHTAWLGLTAYYAAAFKTGKFPDIEEDKIFMWSRTHPSRASAPDPVGQPANFELLEDAVWAVVMTKAPSTVTLSTSPGKSKTFDVPAGLTKLSIPISAGGTMKGTIERDGQTMVELDPPEFSFEGNPKTYNFNAFVVSATSS